MISYVWGRGLFLTPISDFLRILEAFYIPFRIFLNLEKIPSPPKIGYRLWKAPYDAPDVTISRFLNSKYDYFLKFLFFREIYMEKIGDYY